MSRREKERLLAPSDADDVLSPDDSDSDEDGSDDSDSEPPSTKKKRHAKVPKVASKSKKAKRTKVSSAAAPVAGAVAALREVCKRAGLTYQHVFMRHKEDDARIEALESILRDNGLDANASEKAVAKVRAKVELELCRAWVARGPRQGRPSTPCRRWRISQVAKPI